MATFGQTNTLPDWEYVESNTFVGCKFTLSVDGDIESISAYVQAWGDAVHIKAILATSADPATILATGSAELCSNGSYSWVTSTFASAYEATAGEYILGFVCENYVDYRSTSGDTGQHVRETDNNYGTPTAPSGLTALDEEISIYATYTATGGPEPPPIGGGHLMCTATGGLSTDFPLELISHLVIEYVTPNSVADPTLEWGASNLTSATDLVNRAHAAGALASISVWTAWDRTEINAIFANATYRAALIDSIVDIIDDTGADGIYFNWESYSDYDWDVDEWATFIDELAADAGMSGKIISGTNSTTAAKATAATVNDHYSWMYVNVYDLDPYPEGWFGTLAAFQTALTTANATWGFDKDKICGGINIAWRGGSSYPDNWISWQYMRDGYDPRSGKYFPVPADNQNSVPASNMEWGYIYGCGYNLAREKAQWAMENGFAGIKMYIANIDAPLSTKAHITQLNTIVIADISIPEGGARWIRFNQGTKLGGI